MGFVQEFGDFLAEYKVVGLAVAFIIGTALTSLTQSLVNNIVMPVVGVFLPNGDWQTATVVIASANIVWGAFVSSLINFLIIALVVFAILKLVDRKGQPKKAAGK
ncbi:Large-conductance mechanosensitive channel [uncultured archaeon]|nr:Large-conductance mechanosensitive channel [uncultured archaeon]